jgi:exopolyphosphatase / guanosine-5'-triphosphate,3'-diphosphate pyrophosphatase
MPLACIDIGSNTTRLLVAELTEGRLRELAAQRAYTRIVKDLGTGDRISAEKIAETAGVVARQVRVAADLGAEKVAVVGTAVVREAANRDELARAVAAAAGVQLETVSEEEEARLAFLGATAALGGGQTGIAGVVDVGGGSTEIAVGTREGGVSWWRSLRVGSGRLSDAHLSSDPPKRRELASARKHVAKLFADVRPPVMSRCLVVGGTARSLKKVVGGELTPETLGRALEILGTSSAAEVAERFDVDPQRVPLLAGGAVIFEALLERLERPLTVAPGGLREGLVLELAAGQRQGSPIDAAPFAPPDAAKTAVGR